MISLKKSWLVVGAILTWIVLAVILHSVWHNLQSPPSGDEPHYLVMARSLILDHDLDLRNDYALTNRYRDFFGGTLDTHFSIPRDGSEPKYSIHGAGIPLLVAGPMKYWGWRGAVDVMLAVAAALLMLSWLWVFKLTGSAWWSTTTAVIMASSVSYLSLAGHVFPDLIIAGLLVLALTLLRAGPKTANLMCLGLIIGVLPWIHVKTIFYVATLGILALWPLRQQWRQASAWKLAAWLIIPAAILLGLYEWSLLAWYGTLLPTKAFSSSGQLFQISPLLSLSAGLFDATKGLLVNNPAFVLILPGLVVWWWRDRRSLAVVLLLILPTLLLQTTFNDWWGGWSPTGRYWLEFLPLLLPAAGFALADLSGLLWRCFFALALLVQLKYSQIYLSLHPSWRLPSEANPVMEQIQAQHRLNFGRFLPRFSPTAAMSHAWLKSYIMALACLALMGAGLWKYRHTRISRKSLQ